MSGFGARQREVASGGFELPYANAGGVEVSAESARALGRDVARTMRGFLDRNEREA